MHEGLERMLEEHVSAARFAVEEKGSTVWRRSLPVYCGEPPSLPWLSLCFAATGAQTGTRSKGATLAAGPFTQPRGLTNAERQLLLDAHNAWRAYVAAGKEKGAPPPRFMTALEYDDRLEEGAQRWADQCKFTHNDPQENKFKPYFEIGQSIIAHSAYLKEQGIERLTHDWYKEVKDYDYRTNHCTPGKMCGHYTALINANTTYFGCGYNRCKGRSFGAPYIVCHYATAGNVIPISYKMPTKMEFIRPYEPRRGPGACSDCPMQYGFCMDNLLCATKRACDNSNSKCKCMIRQCRNGGRFDPRGCKCDCPKGFEGLLCEKSCADIWPTSKCLGMEHNCYYTKAWRMMRDVCRTSCGEYCGVFQIKDTGMKNRNRIKVNVVDAVVPGPIQKGQKIPKGPCKNRIPDEECARLYKEELCKKNPDWMNYHCPSTCEACSKNAPKPGCIDVWDKADCDEFRGKCGSEPYMLEWCAKTCGLCQKKADWPCEDKPNHDCYIKAAFGECPKSSTTRVGCQKSCNSCKKKQVRGPCKNRDPDSECEERALYGMCILNRRYNERFCASSCNKC